MNDKACRFLKENGWTIVERRQARKPGRDTIATKDGVRLVVMPRGAGNSLPGTNRFGKNFTRSQVFAHTGDAAARLLRLVADNRVVGAIAAPDTDYHREAIQDHPIGPLLTSLKKVRIGVIWVPRRGEPVADVPFEI